MPLVFDLMTVLKKSVSLFVGSVSLAIFNTPVHAALLGQWTFEGANPLADSIGNFPALQLQGNAQIVNGQLDVNGSGVTPTGWAKTVGNYTGPTITNKTLVSWLTLQSLGPTAYSGSAITIDTTNVDNFDAVVLGEITQNVWMAGSNGLSRYQAFNPGFQETVTGEPIQIAITYQYTGTSSMVITGYHNGTPIGSYSSSRSSFQPNVSEIIFGARHMFLTLPPIGSLDALIQEARIYDTALTQAEIQALQPVPAPLPLLGALSGFHACRRMRRRVRPAQGT